MRTLGDLLTRLSIRITDEIRRHTSTERGMKRNAIPRRFHVEEDRLGDRHLEAGPRKDSLCL